MAELQRIPIAQREESAIVQVAALAERQSGVVACAQLKRIGFSDARIGRWLRAGRLHRVHHGVYAVGHRALSARGRLVGGLLYAGPGAMLSHVTSAWWTGIWGGEPRTIHVSTPRRCRSTPGVRVHAQRRLERTRHRGLPVTTVAQTMLDVAAVTRPREVRRALAEAVYQGLVDLEDLEAVAGRGRPGSAALRAAMDGHRPRLAHTLSVLEERFLDLCTAHGIPLPLVNVKVAGVMVDALWPDDRVIVELDGHRTHATPAAVERDRSRELTLRAAGYLVLRYTWRQVTRRPDVVAADLRAALGRC